MTTSRLTDNFPQRSLLDLVLLRLLLGLLACAAESEGDKREGMEQALTLSEEEWMRNNSLLARH